MAKISRWGKAGIILYLFAIHLLALFFVLDKINEGRGGGIADSHPITIIDSPTRFAPDTARPAGAEVPDPPPQPYAVSDPDTAKLLIPVVGVKRKQLQDTYTQSRSGGRTHNAIDIMAAEGTPVVAVADGEIAKFFESKQGGTTIYQWGQGRERVYYYAHLQRRAEGLAEGDFVKRGTVIGYVGNTGNAGPDNFHLHFSIIIPTSPDRHWDGTEINPYPLLHAGIEVPTSRE